ncbi:MAG: hypothetical protein K0B09_00785 [Bacteroidales bacterium]|nr:hypothetical protein [Bacteroidales bacterium]
MFKKDSWTLGILIGAGLPVLVYALAILILGFWGNVEGLVYTPKPQVPGLIGLAASIIAFRYYMLSLKFDKTGRGILVAAFVLFLANFILL